MTIAVFPIRCMLEEELATLPDEIRSLASGFTDVLHAIEPVSVAIRPWQPLFRSSSPFAEANPDEQAAIVGPVRQVGDILATIELARAGVARVAEYLPLTMAQIDALIDEIRAALDAAHAYIGSVRTTATPPRADSSPAAPLPFLPKERK